MTNRINIQDDGFIPEGLEFRQEYLDKAMVMYRHQKLKIWWRRVYVISGVAASIVAAAVLIWLNAYGKIETAENENTAPLLNHIDSAQLVLNENRYGNDQLNSDDEVDSAANSSASQKIANQDINDVNKEAEDHGNPMSSGVGLPDLKPIQDKKAQDHGGSVSSGSGSPDRKPHDYTTTFDHGEKMSSGVDSPDQELITQPDLINNHISDVALNQVAQKLDKEANAVPPPGIVDLDAISGKIPFLISSIPGAFNRTEPSLSHSKTIEVEKWFRWKPYLLAGINPLSLYGSDRSSIKPDWYIAAGLDYQMHSGWNISADAHVYAVSGLSHPYVVDQTKYNQGYSTSRKTYFTDQLYYAGMMIGTRKSIGLRHDITAGYSLDYLVTGNNTISSNTLTSYENIPGSETKATGYISGFTTFNHSVNAGYQYRLGTNKAIGIRLQYGLSDITNNKYFTLGSLDRNSLINVYFRINLLR